MLGPRRSFPGGSGEGNGCRKLGRRWTWVVQTTGLHPRLCRNLLPRGGIRSKMGIPLRILWRHLLPNAAGPILVNLIFLIPQAIFTEAFLSFLGVGLAAPAASLGTIIQEARSQMLLYPNQMVCPLIVLCVMLLALNTVGTAIERQLQRGKNL